VATVLVVSGGSGDSIGSVIVVTVWTMTVETEVSGQR
jgi:hypothetical protein